MIYPVTTINTRLQPILREIVWHKRQEVTQMHQQMSLASLQRQLSAAPTVRDFLGALQQNSHHPKLIAEIQKASPLYGNIRADFDPIAIAKAYEKAGAACISVFTDTAFFRGSFDSLRAIRQRVTLPLLCKEFIIDPCQVYLARAAGADAVVLMAAILTDREIQDLLRVIHYLGMNALVEVNNLEELDRVLELDDIRLIVINNQNLEDLTVDVTKTPTLLSARGAQLQKLGLFIVSESGLNTHDDLVMMTQAGIHAFIVGESLIKQQDIGLALHSLLQPSS